ncbi:MAG: glycosyltransferase [Crenarchaeota archaeon]|mgnify:CR=1 FL=1|nr:MAG: glycosyltransferase [Thermoproteota archaeon]RDJ33355.1 MAG: glycosyltransferase [Thermoproteota archaeon]RDJ36141.1 MAG: glycosyltransferase [Thermoproteota archaeon]RDJ38773.1 MAG: glycosyltransferase [Thermoproteota archaeon]
MRVLIAADKSRFFDLRQFGNELLRNEIDYKIVDDLEIYDDSISGKKFLRWFKTPKKFTEIINEYKPDFVFTERVSHFSSLVIDSDIPLLIFLRGDYWSESKISKQTLNKTPNKKLEIIIKDQIAKKCFERSTMILPICKHLNDIVKIKYPRKKTKILYQGIESKDWFPTNSSFLKHPCVGLLQNANIWGKTKEMLTLKNVLEELPHVTFYWAGDGPYKDEVLSVLGKYDNFKWLGSLEYPDKVRDFLDEIDIYLLVTGLDMFPHSIQEASLMKKPIIATNIGGISEIIQNDKSGFLVSNNPEEIRKKITILLQEKDKSSEMACSAYHYVKKNFSWEKIAKEFSETLKNLKN